MITVFLDQFIGGAFFRFSRYMNNRPEIKKMKSKKELIWVLSLVLGLIFILVINANLPIKAENRELAKAVFYVS